MGRWQQHFFNGRRKLLHQRIVFEWRIRLCRLQQDSDADERDAVDIEAHQRRRLGVSGAYTLGFGYPQFTVDASGSNGAWVSSSFMPSSGGHIFDVSYNYSSLSNVPTLGIDGAPLTYQSATQPSGTISDTNSLIIGNSASGDFGWPGDICEVFLTRQALSAAQIDAIRRNQATFYSLGGVL